MYSPTLPALDYEFKKWNLYPFNNIELILLFLFSLVSEIPIIISGKILYEKRSSSSKDTFFVKLLIFTCRKLSSLSIFLLFKLIKLSAEVYWAKAADCPVLVFVLIPSLVKQKFNISNSVLLILLNGNILS